MMNGMETTLRDVLSRELFLGEKISDCLLCNGYYSLNHNQPLCRTCHLFLFPSFLSLYPSSIKKSDSCDSGNEEGDNRMLQEVVATATTTTTTTSTTTTSTTTTSPPSNSSYVVSLTTKNEEEGCLSGELERRLEELSRVQTSAPSPHYMLSMPNEVLTNLFKYLDDLSIWNARSVCRRWRHIVDSEFSERQWRAFVEQRWPLFHPCTHKCICWKRTYSKLFESSSCLYCLQNQIISDNLTMTKECTWRYIRLQNEMKNSFADPLDGINAVPLDACLFHWQASIAGPRGSPYEGGLFFLHLQILPDYPLRPPLVHFTTKIFHPNVSRHGDIGLDSIHDNWSLALTITKILISIQSLLTDPYSFVCMEPSIGSLYQQNRPLYEAIARVWTQKYAVYNTS